MTKTLAYAALEVNCKELHKIVINLPDMQKNSVELKVTHCGLCGSDDHLIRGDYGEYAQFPQVCGHEIVGIITEVGDNVKHLKIGQRCGVGWQSSSCHECEWCLQDNEQLCGRVKCTCCEGNIGGFSDKVRVHDSQFVFPIPDELDSAEVAPLLCGGQTVWTPLREQTKKTDKIGVLGLGGLGHMAIKFAKTFGNEVVVAISSTDSKKDIAIEHGATGFISHTNDEEMQIAIGSLDFILVTIATSEKIEFEKFFSLLRPRGTMCFVGMVPKFYIDTFTMGFTMTNCTTSNTGSIKDMKEMLDFCAKNKVGATVKESPMSKINEALDELRSKQSAFRHVLVNDF
jgi:alcohol/geraniol dehydrogenase (NADP+)